MKVVILCGGQGTRIRDMNEVLPKPMLTIGERPILWHIMKTYAAYGITDFVLALGHKGWLIKEYFLNYQPMMSDFTTSLREHRKIKFHNEVSEADWNVTLVNTGEHTMTGGRIWRTRRYIEQDDLFCATYGDAVADIDIAKLIDHHRASGLVGTLSAVRAAGRFGEIQESGGRVVSFEEKPVVTAGRINGGFMVFDGKRIWDYLNDSDDLVFEREPMQRMVRDGELGVYPHDGNWQCMDTPREYALLNDLWNKGAAFWAKPAATGHQEMPQGGGPNVRHT
jgi:glucose-1-phosphate cytidylyltransferase